MELENKLVLLRGQGMGWGRVRMQRSSTGEVLVVKDQSCVWVVATGTDSVHGVKLHRRVGVSSQSHLPSPLLCTSMKTGQC